MGGASQAGEAQSDAAGPVGEGVLAAGFWGDCTRSVVQYSSCWGGECFEEHQGRRRKNEHLRFKQSALYCSMMWIISNQPKLSGGAALRVQSAPGFLSGVCVCLVGPSSPRPEEQALLPLRCVAGDPEALGGVLGSVALTLPLRTRKLGGYVTCV